MGRQAGKSVLGAWDLSLQSLFSHGTLFCDRALGYTHPYIKSPCTPELGTLLWYNAALLLVLC